MAPKTHHLIGRYFHTFQPCDICQKQAVAWQGEILAMIEPGFYLVRLFEWLAGEGLSEKIVRLDEMTSWDFYETGELMDHAYKYNPAYGHRHKQCYEQPRPVANGRGLERTPADG